MSARCSVQTHSSHSAKYLGADIFAQTSQNIRWPRCAEIVVAARVPIDNMSATSPLLFEYMLGWILHQLAPFLDKGLAPLIGYNSIAPMDHRMVEKTSDWCIRLPLVLLCCLYYKNKKLLIVAHIVNIIAWFDRMPAVWDYMCWCALLECTFVAAALLAPTTDQIAKILYPALRAELIVLYFSAAFWKLTSSWFDMHYSCATVLMSELLAGMEPMLPFVKHLSVLLLHAAPNLVAGIEFAVPTFLLLRPRWGVLLALVFHQTINFMPTTYAGGFSISMCTRLLWFLPGCSTSFQQTERPLGAAGLVALATAFMIGIHDKGLDFHGGIFLGLALFYFNAIAAPSPKAEKETMAGFASYALPKMVFITGLFVYGHYVSVALAVYLLYKWTPLELTVFLKRAYNIDTKKLKVSAAAISLTQQQHHHSPLSPPLTPPLLSLPHRRSARSSLR